MLRDPNRPRGNPLFDEADATAFDVPVPRARHPLLSSVPTGDREPEAGHEVDDGEPDSSEEADVGGPGARALLDALVDAGPETAEHLLRAMHELLLAAQTVVEAAERGLDVRGQGSRAGDAASPGSAETDEHPSGRVRRIDLD